ncbi:MAG: radical SAM/SPASM domain-containing protein [Oligoflexales bacterium]|nr:radical SAM/SPASM domain-containing protein [Oligoflexales bacterium]
MSLTSSKHVFQKIHLEITNSCNLKCSFCPEVHREKSHISLEDFEKRISMLAGKTKQVALHLMGEPLLHPHLPQLIEICKNYSVAVNLTSNGVLLRKQIYKSLLNPTVKQINFSLHSFRVNFPNGNLITYLDRIFNFTEEALQLRPELYINYRLWNLQDAAKNLANEEDELFSSVRERFNAQMPEELNLRKKKSFNLRGRLYINFDSEFIWPDLALPNLGSKGTCYGLNSHIGIHVDGAVVPCCLDKEGVLSLGNINTASLESILASPRAENMRQGFQLGELREKLCQKCNFVRRFKRQKNLSVPQVKPGSPPESRL